MQATLACFNQLISLKLDKIELTPCKHGWSYPPESPLLLNVMKTIAKMTTLRRLHFTCGLIEDRHVFELAPICPQLQELGLGGHHHFNEGIQSKLSNESFVFIANNCTGLKVLNIFTTKSLRPKVWMRLSKSCRC